MLPPHCCCSTCTVPSLVTGFRTRREEGEQAVTLQGGLQSDSSWSSKGWSSSSCYITRTRNHHRAYLICEGTVVLVHGVCNSAVSIEQETANVHNKDEAPPERCCRRPVVPRPHLHAHPKLHVNGYWLPPVFFPKGGCRVCFGGVSTLTCAPRQAGQGTDLLKTNSMPIC